MNRPVDELTSRSRNLQRVSIDHRVAGVPGMNGMLVVDAPTQFLPLQPPRRRPEARAPVAAAGPEPAPAPARTPGQQAVDRYERRERADRAAQRGAPPAAPPRSPPARTAAQLAEGQPIAPPLTPASGPGRAGGADPGPGIREEVRQTGEMIREAARGTTPPPVAAAVAGVGLAYAGGSGALGAVGIRPELRQQVAGEALEVRVGGAFDARFRSPRAHAGIAGRIDTGAGALSYEARVEAERRGLRGAQASLRLEGQGYNLTAAAGVNARGRPQRAEVAVTTTAQRGLTLQGRAELGTMGRGAVALTATQEVDRTRVSATVRHDLGARRTTVEMQVDQRLEGAWAFSARAAYNTGTGAGRIGFGLTGSF